jgi:hypothetical protein
MPAPAIGPDTPIGELAEFWLEAKCCGGTTFFPFKRVAARLRAGNETPLQGAIRRFRCKACGGPPRYAAVVERADRGGWRARINAKTGAPLKAD